MQTFWESHADFVSEGPGLSFGGKADQSVLACKWNQVVGDASVDDFFTASSLKEQQEIFDGWPTEELRKKLG